MATLPTYEPTVAFTPQPITSAANVWSALSTTLGEIQKPIVQSIEKKKNDALEIQRLQMGQDIISRSDEILGNSLKNNDKQAALHEYRNTYQDYSDEFVKNVSDKNKVYAMRMLINSGMKGQKEIQARLAAQGKFIAGEELDSIYKTNLNRAKDDAVNPNANSQKDAAYQLGQIRGMAFDAIGNKIYSPEKGMTLDQNAKTQVETQRVIGFGRLARGEGEPQWLGLRAKISNMSREKFGRQFPGINKDTIINLMDTDAQKDLVRAGINKQQLDEMQKNILFQLSNGTSPSPDQVANVRTANPAQFEDFSKQMTLSAQMGSEVMKTKYAPVVQTLNAIGDAEKPLTPQQMKSTDAVNQAAMRKHVANTLNENFQAYIKNPSTYTQNDPVFQSQDEELKDKLVTVPPNNPNWGDQIIRYQQARDDLIIAHQKNRGSESKDIKVVDGTEAQAIATFYNSLDPKEIPAQLPFLLKRYGNNASLAMRNIHDAGTNRVNMLYLGAANNEKSRPFLFQMLKQAGESDKDLLNRVTVERPEFALSKLNQAVAIALGSYQDSLYPTNGDLTSYLNNIQKTVTSGALALMAGNKNLDLYTAAQQSADTLVNNKYQYFDFKPGLGMFSGFLGGNRLRAPGGMSKSTIRNGLDSQFTDLARNPPDNLRIPNYMNQQYPGMSDKKLRQIYISEGLRPGAYINDSTDEGYIAVDKNKVPIQTTDGKFFETTYKDFGDPTSDVYRAIAKSPSLPPTAEVEKEFKRPLLSLANILGE